MEQNAFIIGNSDGIGLGVTKKLLEKEWHVTGISKSAVPFEDNHYRHYLADVSTPNYSKVLGSILIDTIPDLCLYCAGIGEKIDFARLENEINIFNVNLMGMVQTVTQVIPSMLQQKKGHFIGLSSVADILLSEEAPSYHASKAGFSNYLEGLGLALKETGVAVSNIRFGFVDTKMAKGDKKPFMISVDEAVRHVFACMSKKPVRYTAPKIIIPLVRFRRAMMELQLG